MGRRKLARIEFSQNNPRDQKAGNDEENIHSNEAAATTEARMEKDDRQDGDRAKAVDFRALSLSVWDHVLKLLLTRLISIG